MIYGVQERRRAEKAPLPKKLSREDNWLEKFELYKAYVLRTGKAPGSSFKDTEGRKLYNWARCEIVAIRNGKRDVKHIKMLASVGIAA